MAGKPFIHVDGEQLQRLYLVEKLTARQIAERLGISFRTILRRLHEFGITPRQQGPERHNKLRDKAWLFDQYVKQGKSTIKIADEIGASFGVVKTWLEQHGIPRRPAGGQLKGKQFGDDFRRKLSAAKKGRFTGESNPNWRGGLVNPNVRLRSMPNSRKWSAAVRERDGHKCAECGATGRLHAHHIKPWKTHPELRYDVDNGLTLCPPCHQKAHGWRFPAWAYHGKTRTSTGHSQE